MAEDAPAPQVPYIGALISLTSVSQVRYEGILYTLDAEQSTVTVQSVRCLGTEGRQPVDGAPPVPPSPQVYEFIIFRGADILDVRLADPKPAAAPFVDPAIVQAAAPAPQRAPQPQRQPRGGGGGGGGGRYQAPRGGGGGAFRRQEPEEAGDFDFAASNARFDKPQRAPAPAAPSAADAAAADEKAAEAALGGAGQAPQAQPAYAPAKSFFDEISTDEAARGGRFRPDRHTDEETFGGEAAHYRSRHTRGRGRQGRGGGGFGGDRGGGAPRGGGGGGYGGGDGGGGGGGGGGGNGWSGRPSGQGDSNRNWRRSG